MPLSAFLPKLMFGGFLYTILQHIHYTPSTKPEAKDPWQNFVVNYQKNDGTDLQRRENFMKNLHKVEQHNELYNNGTVRWKRKIGRRSDLSREEFVQTHCGTR